MAGKGIDRYVYVTYIRTTPERLWCALTTGEMTRRYYFRTRIEGAVRKGAEIRYVLPDGKPAIIGRVLEAKRGKKLVHEFRTVGWHEKEPASRVTYEIEKEAGAVRLTVIHDRLGKSPGTARDIQGGWPVILSGLKTVLETGGRLFRRG